MYEHVYVCAWWGLMVPCHTCGSQKTTFGRKQFSLSILQVLGIQPSLPSVTVDAFI